ncbi:MAG: CsgG/HfaB family protein [Flavobacteriales bacterium]|nr:CsgG/HfaB family protein [Flavobacteriales bacterium]
MKKILLVLGVILISLSSDAQTVKKKIGIISFKYVNAAVNVKDVSAIREKVTNSFVKTKRFDVLDLTTMDNVEQEKIRQMGAGIDLKTKADKSNNKLMGANYIIMGKIVSAEATKMSSKDSKGNEKITYKAKLAVSLKAIDVATGKIIASETLAPKAGSGLLGAIGFGHGTEREAIKKAIDDIESEIDKFVTKYFPAEFEIAEIIESKRGKARAILIVGGSEFGLQKGDKLYVYELVQTQIRGKKLTRKKKISEVKISSVEDENFSNCKVTKGGDALLTKFEKGAKLLAITNTK